ncbi:membrane-spanning 4-domains subfamily A member 4A-like isoform X1 [Erythrolamprus reginae]|uniref:membrane-spanning 4-domains subfamily A member 4A-like isoform X1 n=1 Tax=Erythrolamprus reginae TaxID=121349 RepID=UPI00396CCF4C
MDSSLNLGSTIETDLPGPVKKFFRGEPLALGITQIFIGITGIIFGILLDVTDGFFIIYISIMMPYWSGILYIISGSVAVAAARNPKIPLVKGALSMNVISAVTAGIGIVILGITLPTVRFHFMYFCSEPLEVCLETIHIVEGILAILLVFTIVEFCIAISLSSFGCKMLCRNTFTETVVVIYQNETPAGTEHLPIDCKQPEFP